MTNTEASVPPRPLPELTPENEFFWTAGRDGALRVQRSIPCGALLFPPTPVCPYCHSTEIDVVEVSGRGTVTGCTVNVHQWLPAMTPPYVIAIVALEEDDRVRLTTNVVGCDARRSASGSASERSVRAARRRVAAAVRATGDPDPGPVPAEDQTVQRVRPMVSSDKFEDKVAISGIGMSELGRRLMRDPLSLAVEACTRRSKTPGSGVKTSTGSRRTRAAAAGPPVTRREASPRWRTPCACARRGSAAGRRRPGSRARS